MSLDDSQLSEVLRRCRAGLDDEEAWGLLIDACNPWLYAMARREWPRRDAADLVQSVWLRMVRNDGKAVRDFRPGPGEKRRLRAYLSKTLVHVVRDLARAENAAHRPPITPLSEEAQDHAINNAEDGRAGIDETTLWRDEAAQAMAWLEKKWRGKRELHRDLVVCQLHFEHGYSASQISRIKGLRISAKNAGNIIGEAKQLLSKFRDES